MNEDKTLYKHIQSLTPAQKKSIQDLMTLKLLQEKLIYRYSISFPVLITFVKTNFVKLYLGSIGLFKKTLT